MTPEELEAEKAVGRTMLAAAIPFPVWLGMCPRTAGDVAVYHELMGMVCSLAKRGNTADLEADDVGDPIATTKLPESQFFYVDDAGALNPR